MNNKDEKWALVTGASGGLGEAFARRLAAEGWNLLLAARSREKLETAAAEARKLSGRNAEIFPCDLSGDRAGRLLYDAIAARGIKVDLIINNAGAGLFGESVELDQDRVAAMLRLDVLSLTELSSLFGADMKARGSGSILNVASVAGRAPMPYFASYGAAKSYVFSYSLALRAELAPYGVRVCCLLPGYIRTSFDSSAGITSPRYRAFSDRNAMSPEAVATCGLDCLRRGRGYAAAGLMNKLSLFGMALLPVSRIPFIMKPTLDSLMSSKEKK